METILSVLNVIVLIAGVCAVFIFLFIQFEKMIKNWLEKYFKQKDQRWIRYFSPGEFAKPKNPKQE